MERVQTAKCSHVHELHIQMSVGSRLRGCNIPMIPSAATVTLDLLMVQVAAPQMVGSSVANWETSCNFNLANLLKLPMLPHLSYTLGRSITLFMLELPGYPTLLPLHYSL